MYTCRHWPSRFPAGAVSAALELTLQLTACLLSHAAVLDRSTAAATRALLPDLMTQTADSLRQMAALVTSSYQVGAPSV